MKKTKIHGRWLYITCAHKGLEKGFYCLATRLSISFSYLVAIIFFMSALNLNNQFFIFLASTIFYVCLVSTIISFLLFKKVLFLKDQAFPKSVSISEFIKRIPKIIFALISPLLIFPIATHLMDTKDIFGLEIVLLLFGTGLYSGALTYAFCVLIENFIGLFKTLSQKENLHE